MILSQIRARIFFVLICASACLAVSSPWGTANKGLIKPISETTLLPIQNGNLVKLAESVTAEINISKKYGIFGSGHSLLQFKTALQVFEFPIKKLDWINLENGTYQTVDKNFQIKSLLKKEFISDTVDWREVAAEHENICVEDRSWCGDVIPEPDGGECRNPKYECLRYEIVERPAYKYCAQWKVLASTYSMQIFDQNQQKIAAFDGEEKRAVTEEHVLDDENCIQMKFHTANISIADLFELNLYLKIKSSITKVQSQN